MKINKLFNKLLLFLIIILFCSCQKKQSETYILYMNESISTPLAVNKSSFFSYGTVFKSPTNLEQAEKLDNKFNEVSIEPDSKYPDLRYIIVHKTDTIGLDRYGNTINYSKNNLIKKFKNINRLIKNIILENKDEIEIIKEGPRIPQLPVGGFK